jgi:formylglycine-generating enzyme required for sulfatase activity
MKLGIAGSIAVLFVFSPPLTLGEIEKRQISVNWVHSEHAGIDFTKTEITVAQFRYCVEEDKCEMPKSRSDNKHCNWGYSDRDNHPINCVDWDQASDFCSLIGGRLPTEQEWEAEASEKWNRDYPWGNQKVTCNYVVWGDGKKTDGCGRDSTWPVCSKERGNSVSGLCARGGSWGSGNPEVLRASYREGRDTTRRTSHYGFRCARDVR